MRFKLLEDTQHEYTYQDMLDTMHDMREDGYPLYFNDIENNIMLLAPNGELIGIDNWDTHNDFGLELLDYIYKHNKEWATQIEEDYDDMIDYLTDELGFITLNTGNMPEEDRTKIVFRSRPTDKQYRVLKGWIEQQGKYAIDVYGRNYHKQFRESEYSPHDIIRTIQRSFISYGLDEELYKGNKELNETKYIDLNVPLEEIDKYINNNYRKTKDINSLKSTSQLINKEGYFIDLGDNTHIQILKDLVDNNVISQKDSDLDKINLINTDLFTELGYIRCNSDIHEYTYVQLPKTNITSAQYKTLRDWLDDIASKSDLVEGEIHIGLDVDIIDGPGKYYSYVPDVDYIINRIKRYYASGNLYEKLNKDE